MAPQLTTLPVLYIKDIRRNRDSRDWDAYICWADRDLTEYVGSADTYTQAEAIVEAYAYDILSRQGRTFAAAA